MSLKRVDVEKIFVSMMQTYREKHIVFKKQVLIDITLQS